MADDQNDDANRCGGCTRRLTSGWYLCNACSGRFDANLLEIAERHRDLTARSGYEPGRYDKAGGGKPGTKPPGRVDIMALRDFRSGQSDPITWRGADGKVHRESEHDTPAVLRAVLGWCETIAEQRGFVHEPWLPTPRRRRRPRIPRFTMADHDEMTGAIDWDLTHRYQLAVGEVARRRRRDQYAPRELVEHATDWLTRQNDWIARWPYAGDLFDNARRLRNRLRSATGEPNPKPAARCIAYIDDTECGAPVWLPTAVDTTPSYVPVVRCSGRHRHEYTRGDLARLAIAQGQSEQQRQTG